MLHEFFSVRLSSFSSRAALTTIILRNSRCAFIVPLTTGNDKEIVSDFAALLTLLCRRLVTVSAKVREQYDESQVLKILADCPIPVVTNVNMSYWKERPLGFIYGREGVEVKSYHPPNLPFPSDLGQTLLALAKLKTGPAIVRASRLYASAMERIESQLETSYQLLISAAETMAGAVIEDFDPGREVKLGSKVALVSYAMKEEKLGREVAERLAVEACKDNPWSGRKFTKFLLDNVDREELNREDKLFMLPQKFCPKEDQIEDALREIYRNRGGAMHGGHSYPASAAVGTSCWISVQASQEFLDATMRNERPFPPIAWFERVVNSAICRFIRSQVTQPAYVPGGK